MTSIDILVPHYGELADVLPTLESVRAQTDPHWRLTVVDDSGERADPALAAWCADLGDERVRYLRNERNLGINRNFQRCVDLAELDAATLVGCDDELLPTYVATVRAALDRHPDVAVVQPGVEVVDDAGAPARSLADLAKRRIFAPRVDGPTVLRGEPLAASLLRGNWTYFPSLCWRTPVLRRHGFQEGLDIVLDLRLLLDLVLDGDALLVEPTPAFRYRRHRASVSSVQASDGRRFAEERAFFLDMAEVMAAQGWPTAARAARRHTSSRINAATRLPSALRARDGAAARALATHALGRRR